MTYHNDSEHTRALVKNCLKDKINILPWPEMSLNHGPIQDLWPEIKVRTNSGQPSNLVQLEQFSFEEYVDRML